MDINNLKPLSIQDFNKANSKTLYRSICVPSTTQSYSLCIEYVKQWFLTKFPENTFKSVYTDGKNVFDEFRRFDRKELLKREKPALAIIPSISWDFNNENIDSYPYGMDLYTQTGLFKESFFSYPPNDSYLGIGMQTLLMPFNIMAKFESRAQQLDMYSYIKMACRVGFTNGEDVDLDFHVPYALMIQLAKDNGFQTEQKPNENDEYEETISDVPSFLKWLNMHSSLPFLYKFRALNGKNEFFIKMRNMYVHIRSISLDADDGEREGQTTNNYTITYSLEVRFPAPKMYAYYSNNAHKLTTVYSAWYKPGGPVTTCYTFKGTDIPEFNKYNWPLYVSTTYEDENLDDPLTIKFDELLKGNIKDCIYDCINKNISPSIFCDFIFYNREYINGTIDWNTLTFTSDHPVKNIGTYIGIYVDFSFINSYITKDNKTTRIESSK